MYVLGMLRADPFVYDNEWGLRTRRKGWPRDASAELGPGADPGVSDGRKLFVALVVRIVPNVSAVLSPLTPLRARARRGDVARAEVN